MSDGAAVHRGEIVTLTTTALAIFIVTVVIGILNGTDLVEFDHGALMAHVHAGTLGWITLSVMAATLILFGSDDGPLQSAPRVLAPVLALTVVVYVAVFASSTDLIRPVVGSVTGAVITAFAVWAAVRSRRLVLSTPRLGLLIALFTSVAGAVLGVLWGILIATGDRVLPAGGEPSHPATMVIGFLLPTGMALAEWHLHPGSADRPADRAGKAQMGVLFAGAVLVIVGILTDTPPIVGLSLPLEIAAVVLFWRRLGPAVRAASWTTASIDRWFAASAVAVVVNLAYFAFLIVRYEGDFDLAPERLILALDHIMFIGVTTTAIFGLLELLGRPVGRPAAEVVFWGVVVGLAGFVLGLWTDLVWFERLSTPVLGAGILTGVAVHARDLFVRRLPA